MKPAKFTSEWLQDYERKPKTRTGSGAGLPAPVPEPPVRNEPLAKEQGEKANTVRPVLCIISFRARLLDQDNCTGGSKYLQDALRYSGVIDDDAIGDVDLRVYQHKVRTVKEEKTLVLLYEEPVPW